MTNHAVQLDTPPTDAVLQGKHHDEEMLNHYLASVKQVIGQAQKEMVVTVLKTQKAQEQTRLFTYGYHISPKQLLDLPMALRK